MRALWKRIPDNFTTVWTDGGWGEDGEGGNQRNGGVSITKVDSKCNARVLTDPLPA